MNKKSSKAITYYPIFLNLQDRRCVVIGGGKVALRKIKALLDCGAKVTMISPEPHPEIVKLSKKKVIRLFQRDYRKEDLNDAAVAFACTGVKEINRRVAEDSKKLRVPVNITDDPGLSEFIIPSFFRRGDLTIAVSTAGVSPALARKIRKNLEKSLGKEYASLVSLIGEVRSALKKRGCAVDGEAWQKVLELHSLMRFVKEGRTKKAKTFLVDQLKLQSKGRRPIRS